MTHINNVLVLGGGAREHALAWKLDKSQFVDRIFVAPGNACRFSVEEKTANELKSVEKVIEFCIKNSISLVVIGPEKEICAGWSEAISNGAGCAVFAPSSICARLEASKSYAKQFMNMHNLPTAAFQSFNDLSAAISYVNSTSWSKIVIKEDGLCAGKGVSICETKAQAIKKIEEIFNASNNCVVVEEFLDGYEVSAMCFSDGTTISRLPLSQDHKRALESDLGENTGGMGAIAPIILTQSIDDQITDILQTTIDALKKNGTPYKGILYAGLMITSNGPKILEYNCRFGDPETEILMRLLESDLYTIMHACVDGTLADLPPPLWAKCFSVGIVIASTGYPHSFPTGLPINDIPEDDEFCVTFFAGAKYLNNGSLVNSGGRVLCITCINKLPFAAKAACLRVIDSIQFSSKHFRRDIGDFVLMPREVLNYQKSGVNIDEGNAFVDEIKHFCKTTLLPGTEQIGGFGALIDLKAAGFDSYSSTSTQLIVGMDGVGTKLELAEKVGDYSSLGFDLVGMCANDVLCHAARPLAFLDYYVTGNLEKIKAAMIVKSIAEACIDAECALIGGETAEMPGVYAPNQWDVAGCCIGARNSDWPQLPLLNKIAAGDHLIGVSSNGLHSNGFSLVRKILEECDISLQNKCPWDESITFGRELLRPTKIYIRPLLKLAISGKINAIAHITGGGIIENLPRVLPKHLAANIWCNSWRIPLVFTWLQTMGSLTTYDMLKTFNCGIGVILLVSAKYVEDVHRSLSNSQIEFYSIGKIVEHKIEQNKVIFDRVERLFPYSFDKEFIYRRRVNIGILISGTGSNMVELIKRAQKRGSRCYVSVVISNRANVGGLETARALGITAITLPSSGRSREEFESDVLKELKDRGVELVCLAGFMRILTNHFINHWPNRIINVHPSLLPAFKGANAVRLALETGVKVTGCTVHYVVEDIDAGKILAQEIVYVENEDDEVSLHKKIKVREHALFPHVMDQQAARILAQANN